MIKKVWVLFFLTGLLSSAHSQSAKTLWVDSVFNTLKISDKIGQLFMVPLTSQTDEGAINEIENVIKSHRVGGIIFTRGTPVRQAKLVNAFQRISEVPLLVGQDAEWGLGTSLDSAFTFPRSLLLGAIENDTLLYRYGSFIAEQLKLVGVSLNFAPVINVLSPPFDPAIQYRSFGENPGIVARKSVAYMRGLQDHGVIACAKHFTIKGLTVSDVKNNLPVLTVNIDEDQAFTYAALFKQGLKGAMPAASELPLFYEDISLLKKTNYRSSTLTSLFTGDYLKRQMNYDGLVFVDIDKVKGITEKERYGEAELFAFQAGNDVLMNPNDIGVAIRKIRRLVRRDENYAKQLDHTVKKILAAKFDAGLWQNQRLNTDNLAKRLNTVEAQLLNQKLHEAAITVIRNEENILPVKNLENKHVAYITSEATEHNRVFYNYLNKYTSVAFYAIDESTDLSSLLQSLHDQEVIIAGVFPQTPSSTLEKLNQIFQQLSPAREIIVCDFGSPSFLASAHNYSTVVTAYVNTAESLKGAAQTIFGAIESNAKIPFTTGRIQAGTGVNLPAINRLAYSVPEDAGMNSRTLQRIDSIAKEAIRIGATPGCQVWVARNGKVVYEKSFGHFTYNKKIPVTEETIYDLASITKVAATLQTAMFMYERGLIDLHKKVSYYLPELRKTNKKDITLVDMLTHQSGLVPFIPLYPQTMKDTTYLPLYYSRIRSEKYPLQVGSNLFASRAIRDSVWVWIVKSKMGEKAARTPHGYKYSDLGFLILQHLAEKLLNQPLADFVQQNLYEPLGANTMGFNPLNRFPMQAIAPTEDDKIYRRTLVSGTVHDERAAMMGGVAGHAGLFSNANDLGKLGQMLLQEGHYGGVQYYKPETVRLFTGRKYQTSRRGIGWDKPVQSDWNSPTSLYASPKTFGHTGFTGTCIWIDPEFNLVYIFLSNRVYPDRNAKLINASIRSRIQDVIYRSIFHYDEQESPHFIVRSVSLPPSTQGVGE